MAVREFLIKVTCDTPAGRGKGFTSREYRIWAASRPGAVRALLPGLRAEEKKLLALIHVDEASS